MIHYGRPRYWRNISQKVVNMSDFRFKRLEQYQVGGTRDKMDLSIPFPRTPSGKMYRLCPVDDCAPRLFLLAETPTEQKISEENNAHIRRLPGTPGITCPYCGNDAPDNDYTHPEDLKAAKEFIKWAAMEDAGEYMEGLAKNFNREVKKAGKGIFSVEMDFKRSRMTRPHVWREDLLRNLSCDICGREYGVYAIALFCPDCGSPNIHIHIHREVELITHQIHLAEKLSVEGDQELIYRLLGNAHEDVLTMFETYLKTIYQFLVKKIFPLEEAKNLISKRVIGNKFQNIERGRKLFTKINIDPYDGLEDSDLEFIRRNIEKRHVVGHNLSMADEAYAESTQAEEPGRTVHLLADEITRFAYICSSVVTRLENNL